MHPEESPVFEPFERGMGACDSRWISWKHQFDTPLTNEDLKGLQCWIGLKWKCLCLSGGEVICHHAFPFPFSRGACGSACRGDLLSLFSCARLPVSNVDCFRSIAHKETHTFSHHSFCSQDSWIKSDRRAFTKKKGNVRPSLRVS